MMALILEYLNLCVAQPGDSASEFESHWQSEALDEPGLL